VLPTLYAIAMMLPVLVFVASRQFAQLTPAFVATSII
jgi:hypothetical protein